MNTQNVKTATSESTETWDKTAVSPAVMMACASAAGLSASCYPDAGQTTTGAYYEIVAARWRSAVKEIDEARYEDQLYVMRPCDWTSPGEGLGQSFKSAECWSGDVTSIFAIVRGRYFEFRDRKILDHAAIVARITEEVFNKEQA